MATEEAVGRLRLVGVRVGGLGFVRLRLGRLAVGRLGLVRLRLGRLRLVGLHVARGSSVPADVGPRHVAAPRLAHVEVHEPGVGVVAAARVGQRLAESDQRLVLDALHLEVERSALRVVAARAPRAISGHEDDSRRVRTAPEVVHDDLELLDEARVEMHRAASPREGR